MISKGVLLLVYDITLPLQNLRSHALVFPLH